MPAEAFLLDARPCTRLIAERAAAADLLPLADQDRRKARENGMRLQPGPLRVGDATVEEETKKEKSLRQLFSPGGGVTFCVTSQNPWEGRS
jgi:hypothetical protein